MPLIRDASSLAEQAAHWLVLLTGDDPAQRTRAQAGFSAWKAADPLNAEAAARIESFVDQVHGVRHGATGDPRPARAALDAAYQGQRQSRRAGVLRRAGGALLLAVALAVPTWFAVSGQVPSYLLADIHSRESEWVSRTLSDGTRITLSGTAAVRLRYDAQSRTVELLGGDIQVDVAKDAERPFYVETPLARIRALGTRFAVSHADGVSSLQMFESEVAVQPLSQAADGTAKNAMKNAMKNVVVRAGEQVQLTRQGVGRIEPMDAERVEEGWRHRQLVLDNRPLPEVLEQLARHRPGGIHYDGQQLEPLRVTGLLPLDKPDEALQLLQSSFPEIRVRFVAGRWAWVDLKAEQKK